MAYQLRPAVAAARMLRTADRYDPSSIPNSTSVSGNSPAFSRISFGIVTWPLDVIRIAASNSYR